MHFFEASLKARTAQTWAAARAAFTRMQAIFGGPASIAAINPLTRALRRQVLTWLAPLEVLVRKLILIEAAHFSGVAPFARRKAPRRADLSAPRAVQPLNPEDWSAGFRVPIPADDRRIAPGNCAPRIRSLGPPLLVRDIWREQAAAAPPPPPPRRTSSPDPALSVWRLARRVEALRRALDNPTPHARRLARKLARMRPSARRECARRIACAHPPRGNPELDRPLRDAALTGCTAADRFDTS